GGQPAGRGVTDTGPPADPGDQGHPSAQRGRIAGEFNVGHVPDAGGPSGAGQTLFPRAPGPSRLRGGALLAAAAEVPSHAACPIVLRAARFSILRPPARLSAGSWPTPRPPTGPAPPSHGPASRTRCRLRPGRSGRLGRPRPGRHHPGRPLRHRRSDGLGPAAPPPAFSPGPWLDHDAEPPVAEGTLVRLVVERLPGDTPPTGAVVVLGHRDRRRPAGPGLAGVCAP